MQTWDPYLRDVVDLQSVCIYQYPLASIEKVMSSEAYDSNALKNLVKPVNQTSIPVPSHKDWSTFISIVRAAKMTPT